MSKAPRCRHQRADHSPARRRGWAGHGRGRAGGAEGRASPSPARPALRQRSPRPPARCLACRRVRSVVPPALVHQPALEAGHRVACPPLPHLLRRTIAACRGGGAGQRRWATQRSSSGAAFGVHPVPPAAWGRTQPHTLGRAAAPCPPTVSCRQMLSGGRCGSSSPPEAPAPAAPSSDAVGSAGQPTDCRSKGRQARAHAACGRVLRLDSSTSPPPAEPPACLLLQRDASRLRCCIVHRDRVAAVDPQGGHSVARAAPRDAIACSRAGLQRR